MKKEKLSFWQIWNLSFGFLGVQIGYSLQNANTSRILQSLGADVSQLSYFWLAAPLAGLIVQPIVGLFSDITWTRFGRRIPFILAGSVLATISLALMPNAEMFVHLMPALLFGGIMFLFMDMAFNVTMQPFRALVADMVGDSQRTKGYAIQTFLINVGAVVGSVLPFVLTTWVGLSNASTPDTLVPQTVAWSYYIGAAILMATVLVTTFRTKEYPPEKYFEGKKSVNKKSLSVKELIKGIPSVMWQLAIVQFFSWFALFVLWTYTTPAVASNVWNTTDSTSLQYNEAANWVGILFAVYSVVSALFAIVMVWLAKKISNKGLYSISLILGGLGYLGLVTIENRYALMIPMIGIGVAWAAILAMPYTILSKSIPSERMGLYMGVFNFTITVPQIVCGLVGGVMITYLFNSNAKGMVVVGAIALLVGAFSVFLIKEKKEIAQ